MQYVPEEEYRDNIMHMVKMAKQKKISIVLITPPPVDEVQLQATNAKKGKSITLDRLNNRTLRYVNVIKDLGTSIDVPVVDLWSGLYGASEKRTEYLSDGLHYIYWCVKDGVHHIVVRI